MGNGINRRNLLAVSFLGLLFFINPPQAKAGYLCTPQAAASTHHQGPGSCALLEDVAPTSWMTWTLVDNPQPTLREITDRKDHLPCSPQNVFWSLFIGLQSGAAGGSSDKPDEMGKRWQELDPLPGRTPTPLDEPGVDLAFNDLLILSNLPGGGLYRPPR
jgi:hypothetical protein